MDNIKLSPLAISSILDINIDHVIFMITGERASKTNGYPLYIKERNSIRKKYKNVLYNLSELPKFTNVNAVSPDLSGVCLLRETISQCNKTPIFLMQRIIRKKECVKTISFASDFKYYDLFLNDEVKDMILDKLAEIHYGQFGETDTYKKFISDTD